MSECSFEVAFPRDGGVGNIIQTVRIKPSSFLDQHFVCIELPPGVCANGKLTLPREFLSERINEMVR